MPIYVMLSKLTEGGADTIKRTPGRIKEVNTELESMGVVVKHQYACLGEYDFVSVVEADDDLSVAKASVEMGSRGSVHIQTLSAIPIDDFIAAIP